MKQDKMSLSEITNEEIIILTPTLKMLFDKLISEKIVSVCWSTGSSWKYSTLHDYRNEMCSLLEKKNIPYQLYNDAPRGGKLGWKIKLK